MLRECIRVVACAAALTAVAGCGDGSSTSVPDGEGQSTTRQVPVARAVPSKASTGSADATAIVNQVCIAVREGAPRALAPPFTAAVVRRHLRDARSVARRVEVSLRRLGHAQPEPPRDLDELRQQATQLRRVYAAAAVQVRATDGAARAGQAIASREAMLSDVARRSGYPACAIS